MSEYVIRPFDDKKTHDVVELLSYLIPGPSDLRRRYFEWKYLHNPFAREPSLILAHLDGRAAGMRGAYGSRWREVATGRAFVLPHADDLSIHPDHRNRGLFLPIMEALLSRAAARGHDHMIGLGGGTTTQALALATGWTSLGTIDRHVRPARPRSRASRLVQTVRGLSRRLSRPGSGRSAGSSSRVPPEAAIDRIAKGISRYSDHLSVSDSSFYDDIRALAEATPRARAPRFRSDRSRLYLRWRLENPDRRYRLLVWEDGDSKGYVILSWPSPSPRDVWIADLGYTDDSAFLGLVEAVCSSGDLGVTMMTVHLADACVSRLSRLGFVPLLQSDVPSQIRQFLVIRTTCDQAGVSTDDLVHSTIDDWAFNLLDTMAT